MNFIKIRNTCKDCPYLQTPAIDLHKIDQYYSCRLVYANSYNIDHLQEVCPLKNILNILIDYVCFRAEIVGGIEFSKEKKIINDFIEEKL